MSYHVLSGRFAFFYGPQAQAPANFPTGSVAGSVWQPVANTAQPTYTVLVLEFDRGEVGATGVSDLSHFEGRVGSTANPNDLGDQKVVLVSNWEPGPTPGSIVPTDGGHMYCDPGLDKGARSALQNILFGSTTTNMFYLFNALSQSFVEEATVTYSAGAAHLTDLAKSDTITISGVGTLTIP
ncbi:MAG: hypothetical protein ACJ78Q_11645 [Chloroflexia bacterium]